MSLNSLHTFRGFEQKIAGWMEDGADALWDVFADFQTSLGVTGDLIEIGVYHGKSAAFMALHADPEVERLILIDKELRVDKVRESLALASWPLDESRTVLVQGNTLRLAAHSMAGRFSSDQVRWIHIDGDHSARAVFHDLALAHELLQPGGVVTVDDFFRYHHPQVTAGVYKYLAANPTNLCIFAAGYGKAYLCRPEARADWFRMCRDDLADALSERGLLAAVWKSSDEPEAWFGVQPRAVDEPPIRGLDHDPSVVAI